MSGPELKISRRFAEYLFVNLCVNTVEYDAYSKSADVPPEHRTREMYIRTHPGEALAGVTRRWFDMPAKQRKVCLRAYIAHLNVPEQAHRNGNAWVMNTLVELERLSDTCAGPDVGNAANDVRIGDLIEAAQAPFTAEGTRREILDLRTALHQAWLRMSKEARDDLVRLYGATRMSRQPGGADAAEEMQRTKAERAAYGDLADADVKAAAGELAARNRDAERRLAAAPEGTLENIMITIKFVADIIGDQTETPLTGEQLARCAKSALDDSRHWAKDHAEGKLPDISTMHLDWQIDADLRDAGVTPELMQRLSFAILKVDIREARAKGLR